MARFTTLDGTYYNASAMTSGRKYINANLVSTSVTEGNFINYFTISYKDGNSQAAKDKLSIIDFAIDKEINSVSSKGEEYFNGIKISINPSTDPSIASNTSNRRIIIIATLIGVAVAAIVLFLKQILDDTMKDKEELEKIIGKPVIAYIAYKEEA